MNGPVGIAIVLVGMVAVAVIGAVLDEISAWWKKRVAHDPKDAGGEDVAAAIKEGEE